ncbi:SMI1/KNR4 family protein [Streptomyces sp. NPDC052051]|uniref:SMI1/KNR4 family protein n=1 Tax=Streptomyces sp. NPDC052051 TaxID=3154649 RepID=UPI00342B1D7C
MEIQQMLAKLMAKNTAEYLSMGPGTFLPIPRLYPPASAAQIAALEQRAGQRLEPGYREFLLLTDGMDGFNMTMPLFGCHDWDEGVRVAEALVFLAGIHEDATTEDVGLPADVGLFPVSVDDDRTRAIFMLDCPDALPERFWKIGEGSSSFFGTFTDMLGFTLDPHSYAPRETIA